MKKITLIVFLLLFYAVYHRVSIVNTGYCSDDNTYMTEERALDIVMIRYYKDVYKKVSGDVKLYLTYDKFKSVFRNSFRAYRLYQNDFVSKMDKYTFYHFAYIDAWVDDDYDDEFIKANGGINYDGGSITIITNCGRTFGYL